MNPCRGLPESGLRFELNKTLRLLARLGVLLTLVSTSLSIQAAVTDALDRPAISTQLGPYSFLLGAAQIDERLVVVGERGLILLSDDNAQSWKQAPAPVSVTLTAVKFADSLNGFAIGHAGTVLATKDGGESWSVRLDGWRIAEIILASVKATGDEHAINSARQLVSDGPDKPLLDLLVINADQVVVVGAYGIALITEDGGQTWNSWVNLIDNPGGQHLYNIRKSGNRILISGEMGMVWLSIDDGNSFNPIETPYEGSFFTAELIDNEIIILAGLRGNVWRSDDNGAEWYQLANPVPATITASLLDKKGELVMVNQAGMILHLHDKSLVPHSVKSLPPLNNVLRKSDGELLVLSARGLFTINSSEMN